MLIQEPTEHGRNIASQIQEEDAYGESDSLNYADVYIILDELHSHFVNLNDRKGHQLMTKFMEQLETATDLDTSGIL